LIGRNRVNLIVGWCGRFLFFVVPRQFSQDIGEWPENQILIPDWTYFHCPGATLCKEKEERNEQEEQNQQERGRKRKEWEDETERCCESEEVVVNAIKHQQRAAYEEYHLKGVPSACQLERRCFALWQLCPIATLYCPQDNGISSQ